MKRLLVIVVLSAAIVWAHGEQVPAVPFSGTLYLLSWYSVNHDGSLGLAYEKTEFRYPGFIRIREDGGCSIQYTSGILQEYTWERHPEMENVIIISPERGPDSYLAFALVPENDIVQGSWAMSLVGAYTSSVQARTYVVKQSE